MEIKLHKLARTTPAIRKEIQSSNLPARVFVQKYGINKNTVYKWRRRKSVEDGSHTRHNLLLSLSPCEEEMVKELRLKLGLSAEDITCVMNRCVNPNLKEGAIYRTLKRHKISSREKQGAACVAYPFDKELSPGYIHLDTKYLTLLGGNRSYVYVAIDRYSRYVYAEIHYDLKPSTSAGFLERFLNHFSRPVHTILTDNGMEWTDRCAGKVKEQATGKHAVDQVCARNGIKHKLIRPRRPQTNGMVERFNRRIQEAIASKGKIAANSGKNVFSSHEERNRYILDFVDDYNHTRLACLHDKAPLEILQVYDSKRNYDHEEINTFAGMTPL